MNLRSFVLSAAGAALLAGSAAAGTLYGISQGYGFPADNEIYQIDPATALVSNVFPVTLAGFTVSNGLALAAHPATGVLYGVIQTTVGGRRLVTIDPATGIATQVGTLATQISTLAFKSDGTLLGVSGDGAATNPETLYSISTVNGALTLLFALGNGDDGETIAMHPNGLMYHSSGFTPAIFESVDLTTQVVTPIGSDTPEAFAMGYSTLLGQMYISDWNGDFATVDVATGVRSFIGTIPTNGYNRGLAFVEGTPSTPFCTGDAVGTTCLGCGNNGAAGHGCKNFNFVAGALLTSSGTASVTPTNDTLVLTCSSMTGPGLFFQADGINPPITFGDGMLCASTGIIRMGVVFPGPPTYPANTANYPGGLTPNPIHTAGAPITAGQTKYYQCWYRDAGETSPGVSFCTSATFNTSNGISLVWGP